MIITNLHLDVVIPGPLLRAECGLYFSSEIQLAHIASIKWSAK